jgi:peptidoglycan/LPS O-acetylase OafA/YrhL
MSDMKNNHYDFIDSLRGIAILCVIMVHTGIDGRFNVPNLLTKLVAEGARGVQLFYLVSAFTLFLSMENRITKELNTIRNFFIRRFFRIAPMYYIAILVSLITTGFGPRYWLGDAQNITKFNILSNIFFLHGFNPYWIESLVPGGWSIAIEMTFYCILPFLFKKIKTINHAITCFVISIVIRPILYMILIRFDPTGSDHLWGEYLFLYFPSQFPVFCLGIIMYFIVIKKQGLYDISGKTLFMVSLCCIADITSGMNVLALII